MGAGPAGVLQFQQRPRACGRGGADRIARSPGAPPYDATGRLRFRYLPAEFRMVGIGEHPLAPDVAGARCGRRMPTLDAVERRQGREYPLGSCVDLDLMVDFGHGTLLLRVEFGKVVVAPTGN